MAEEAGIALLGDALGTGEAVSGLYGATAGELGSAAASYGAADAGMAFGGESAMQGTAAYGAGDSGFSSMAFGGESPVQGISYASPGTTSSGDIFSKSVDFLKTLPISGGLNIASGIKGLMDSERMKKLAQIAFKSQDPFGDQRAGYQAMLARLMANPGSVKDIPGYQFGLDEGRRAIERRGAASGSGGNEAIALARYTPEYAGNFYNSELARLMQLSGSGIAPTGGSSLIQGNALASDLSSRSLASLGYGARRFGF